MAFSPYLSMAAWSFRTSMRSMSLGAIFFSASEPVSSPSTIISGCSLACSLPIMILSVVGATYIYSGSVDRQESANIIRQKQQTTTSCPVMRSHRELPSPHNLCYEAFQKFLRSLLKISTKPSENFYEALGGRGRLGKVPCPLGRTDLLSNYPGSVAAARVLVVSWICAWGITYG